MRQLSKKQLELARREFALVGNNILESGGKRRTFPSEFEIQTVCGMLAISLDIGCYIHSINCRSADVSKAKAYFEANPHLHSPTRLNRSSGKWNFNATDATDLATAFFLEIDPLLQRVQKSI